MIKAVIFDLDGTLVQTESLKARAYAEAIRRLGNPDTTDEQVLELYKEQIGQTREVVSKFLMEKLGVEDQCRRLLEKSYGNETWADEPWQVLTRMRIEAYEEMIADPPKCYGTSNGPIRWRSLKAYAQPGAERPWRLRHSPRKPTTCCPRWPWKTSSRR